MKVKVKVKVNVKVKIRRANGHERFGMVKTTNHRPKTTGQRPLSFSSGGDLGGFRTGTSALEICLIFDIDFDCQNLEKTMVWGGPNGAKN